jgi:hypothetical protein
MSWRRAKALVNSGSNSISSRSSAAHAKMRPDRNDRFRGHGPLLQVVAHPSAVIAATVL